MIYYFRTIKPLLKKPEEEITKREPSPELAKISALVTRPPKQKAPSKKTEEGNLNLYPALSSESSFSTSLSISSTPRTKRPIFKPLASPPMYAYPSTPSPPLQQQQSTFFYVVSIFLTFFQKKKEIVIKSKIF